MGQMCFCCTLLGILGVKSNKRNNGSLKEIKENLSLAVVVVLNRSGLTITRSMVVLLPQNCVLLKWLLIHLVLVKNMMQLLTYHWIQSMYYHHHRRHHHLSHKLLLLAFLPDAYSMLHTTSKETN